MLNLYNTTRAKTEAICTSLETEDYVVQPVVDVSPPKWHLGHTSWFFETFILIPHLPEYQVFHPDYNYIFNSYYETVGARVIRTNRGNLSRPSVKDIYAYRKHVDHAMQQLLSSPITAKVQEVLVLGINHEQQHQELLVTDIKYILGHNPLFPSFTTDFETTVIAQKQEWVSIHEGVYEIGFKDNGFCFDNELNNHNVYLNDFKIQKELITNREYIAFIEAGGYSNFKHWHSEGWEWVKQTGASAPLYWHFVDNTWKHYTHNGLVEIHLDEPVCHVNFYEASAFANWKGMRLPTEFEWEIAADRINWGSRWEWTNSAYLPYPGFKIADGAIGEYNGKFMVNQMVLRGSSVATAQGHSRKTYRNFFHPHLQWQFMGIRLAQ